MLVRAHCAGYLDDLDDVWVELEAWFAELPETHTSLASLTFFRSPNPHRSWITAARRGPRRRRAAAARCSTCRARRRRGCASAPGSSRCARSPDFFGFEYDPDPTPDDPISITRDEFDEVCDALGAAGVPAAGRP